MADYTTNYNLKKPADTDFYNIADFNGNADIVDTALNAKLEKDLSNLTGTVPVAKGGTGATTVAGACSNIGAVQLSGSTMTGNLEIEKNVQDETSFTVTNPNGSVQLSVNARRGIYDKGNAKWVIKSEPNSSDWTFDGTAANSNTVGGIAANTFVQKSDSDYNLRSLELNATNIDTDTERNYTTGLSEDGHGTRPSNQWQNIVNIMGGHFRGQIAIEAANTGGTSDINLWFRSKYLSTGNWSSWVCATKTFVQSSQPANAADGSLWAW